ncbi:ketoacyl-ACP synthase III [Candidatus Bathyarchaeota archaeon]|nr:ketoacyl-ACP synthase III [Candidatus Bathyarchaeota archaeon]
MRAGIKGIGSYVPPKVMTNDDWAQIVDTSDEWITTKTGISERRIAEENDCTSDLAVKAAAPALKEAGVEPEDLDLVVLATSSPDVPLSSTAAIVQHKLGAVNAGAFDVMAVCTGFIHALDVGARYAVDPYIDNVLVVASEVYSKILNWKDRTTCVFFGDGAGATVLQKTEEGGVIGSWLRADGGGAGVIEIPAGGTRNPISHEMIDEAKQYFYMDGRAVWDFAVEAFPQAVRGVLDRYGYALDDVDMIIPHQANINIIKVGMEKLGLPMERAHTNLHKYGNMAGASIPVALHEAIQVGKISKGDLVVTVGFGGGLTWGANLIQL